MHLYDALKLYALAATKAINETGSVNVTTDGQYLWNKATIIKGLKMSIQL
jgi:hypothetical protein